MSRSRLICFSILALFSASVFAAQVERTGKKVPNEVLIKVREGASEKDVEALEKLLDADKPKKLTKLKSGTLMRVRSKSKNTDALIKTLEKHPQIEFAEPNYILELSAAPNDPSYAQLWGLKNTGQTISSVPGNTGADVDAEAAWNVTTGSSSVVVGVVDTGIDYTHPDLAANMWTNPGGKGNAACAAGTFGFNAITGTCNPLDDEGHGTHVAGTIGAVGNNGAGVTGVNWTASIMALKFLDQYGSGTTADAIAAIDFAIQAKMDGVNVRVLSNSWGGGSFSKALLDVINKANENDILFVASAGNNGVSTDISPQYPAGYTTANMLAVAATDNLDRLAWFSNYGPATVHLGAPGVNVYSTLRAGQYGFLSGTSMAAPHVSGVAALVLAASPSLTTAQVKSAILDNTDPLPSLTGRCITGGRLNAAKAVGGTPTPDFSIVVAPASRVVSRGGATSYALTINAQNGFAGAVDLAVSGLPGGATASITPTPTSTTATLLVTTGSTTPVSTVSLAITGTSGAMTRSATATLTTTTPQTTSPCPSLSLVFGPYMEEPAAFAIADLNGDGKSDYAVADPVSNAVSIRYGRTFSTFSSHAVGRGPVGIATADLNGDGRLDLVTANALADNVSVLLANGSGGFQPAIHYGAGASPFSVAAGDFNRDGALDLATANNGSSSVSILLGQGNGTFAAATQFTAGASPFWVTAADVDADGSLDLAVANFGANTVSLLRGNGDGTFNAPLAAAAGTKPSSLAAADFDGNGTIDLAVSNYGSDNVSFLSGNGDGSFGAPVHYAAGSNPNSISAGDLDGDGRLDLVTANAGADTLSVLYANGGGTFKPPHSLYASSGPTQAVIGDLNDDGRPDIVMGTNFYSYYYYPSVLYFMNFGSCFLNCGALASATDSSVGGTPDSVATGDFNRDGKLDLAIVDNASNLVAIRLGNGAGTFAAGVSAGAGTSPRGITAADFNRDGKLDLAVASGSSSEVAILIGNGDATFQSAVAYAAGAEPRAVVASDFNRDGILDLAVSARDDNAVGILFGDGDGTFQTPVSYAAGTGPRGVAAGDFNRDGVTDLAVANAGSANVSVLLGDPDGTFEDAVNVSVGTTPRAVLAMDLNRDGYTDLAVANIGSNNLSFLAGKGNGTFHAAVNYAVGTTPLALVAADLNVDGRPDLIVANNASHDVSVLLGSDGGGWGNATPIATGFGPTALVHGDFNRDGKTDVVTSNSISAGISVLLNSCPLPDLAVTKTHSGTFPQGATGNYTITVSNPGALATNAPVTVKDTLSAGLAATAISGTGWTCALSTVTCTRIDALAPGASYPPITLTVRIYANAALSVTNNVTVSGGGELNTANSTASDPTTITPATDLVLIKTHAGAFVRGGAGRTYSLVVRNVGGLASSGTVTVTDTLPASLTATGMSGTGWSCNTGSRTCTRNDALSPYSSYPAITLTVSVAADAPTQVTNTATVTGGGDAAPANNTANDPTSIWSASACTGFGSPLYYGNGTGGGSRLVVDDFNNDGHSDVATGWSNLAILLGSGDGTLAAPVNYTARPIGSLAAADLDRDGDLDLVAVTSESDAQVTVFAGQGNGTFAAAMHYDAGTASYLNDLRIVDLDRDGNLDVVTLNSYSYQDALLLFRGNGDGTLRQPETIDTGADYSTWTLSDFNGDTIVDLVFVTFGTVKVKPGNGDGTFGAEIPSALPISVYALTAADFNGDGIQDLAGVAYDDAVVLLGNGNATFAAGVLYPIGWSSSSITTADFNADGKLDIITGGYNLSTLPGNGDGTFQSAATYYADSYRVALTDLNSDGSPDLVYTTYNQIGVRLSGCADVAITKSHWNNFRGGRTGTYQIQVLNAGAGSATGTITVTDHLPEGMTISWYYAYGMDCSTSTATTLTCTRTGTLMPGSYYTIELTVLVSPVAPTSVTNVATVTAEGDTNTANNSASDPTTIVHAPDLVITQNHAGAVWAPGDTGTFTISVGNVGSQATSGTVTVTDLLNSGFSRVSMSGPGWNCDNLTCTRSDALDPTAVYPPITLTVMVLSGGFSYSNSTYVTGGGETAGDTYNNYSSDYVRVLTAPQNVVASRTSASQITVTWSYPYYTNPAPLYEVFRSAPGGPFVLVGSTFGGAFYDASTAPDTAYVYKVRVVENSVLGPFSTPDYASTMTFADDPVVAQSTIIQRVHVEQLRTAVNQVRAAAGLPAATFTDASLVDVPAKKVHMTELRAAVNEARAYLGMAAFVYSDSDTISAVHINQLRASVR